MASRTRAATLGLVGLNAGLRLVIVGVVGHALLRPNDPRYAGKAIGMRGLALVAASFLVPALQLTTRRGERYPLATDTLYLSIFALDLAGNHADLYDRYKYFDAIPHFHGTGAATLVLADLLDRPLLSAVGVAQVGHVLLEAQEYYSDVLFGLRNVRGTWDTVNDLLAGAAGSVVYAGIANRRRRRTLD
jgi:hypothetical protein